jgi:hypothetical protein
MIHVASSMAVSFLDDLCELGVLCGLFVFGLRSLLTAFGLPNCLPLTACRMLAKPPLVLSVAAMETTFV